MGAHAVIGQRFGRWAVVAHGAKHRHWLCRCGCGREKYVHASNLTDGKSTQCRQCGSPRKIPLMEKIAALCIPEPMSGCLLWEGRVRPSDGRPIIDDWGADIATPTVARVVYQETKGPIPPGMLVLHTCDIGLCIEPQHLWLGTQDDNMKDAARKNRVAWGDRNGQAKLREANISSIREQINWGMTLAEIAENYGVAVATISAIKHGKTWRRVP